MTEKHAELVHRWSWDQILLEMILYIFISCNCKNIYFILSTFVVDVAAVMLPFVNSYDLSTVSEDTVFVRYNPKVSHYHHVCTKFHHQTES